jgi:hypothetical protein
MANHPDAFLLDWIEGHLLSIRNTISDGYYKCIITWLDDNGYEHTSGGERFRTALENAVERQTKQDGML